MGLLNQNNIITLFSDKPGPKVCIIGGVHGNERCGYEAIKEITSKNLINLIKGELTFIIANQKAIDQNVRFIDENLNRCFKKDKPASNSYEDNLAKEIMPILEQCDISLDLHAASSESTRKFIICEENAYTHIKTIPIKTVCSGFDSLNGGGTDSFMNSIGKVGICVECGYLADASSTNIAIETVYSFLSRLGMVDYHMEESEKEYLNIDYLYKCKSNFSLAKQFENFEDVKKGDLIGIDGKTKVIAEKDGFILFATNRNKSDPIKESFILGII